MCSCGLSFPANDINFCFGKIASPCFMQGFFVLCRGLGYISAYVDNIALLNLGNGVGHRVAPAAKTAGMG